MKIFEHVVHSHLYAFVHEYSLLYKNQSEFRQKDNICATLTEVTDIILDNMDRGLLTGAVYLYFKKAFNTVDHDILLK